MFIPKVEKDGYRHYGKWICDPKGRRENKNNCIWEIFPKGHWTPYQCTRKRGYGPGGLYCKQHAKMVEADK